VTDADAIYAAKLYLRRKYASNLTGLKQLAEQIACEAFDTVTLTGQSFEGGSHSGQVALPRLGYLRAIEELIIELDPDTVPSAANSTSAYYRFRAPFGLGGSTSS
jgi:hypothetical protein